MEVYLSKKGGNNYVITSYGKDSSEVWPSGQLSHTGQIKTSAVARDQNLSGLVKIIAEQKLLFKGEKENQSKLDPKTQETLDGIKQRKASKKAKSDASQKAKKKQPREVKTPEERVAARKAKLDKMLPKERGAYLCGERIKS